MAYASIVSYKNLDLFGGGLEYQRFYFSIPEEVQEGEIQ